MLVFAHVHSRALQGLRPLRLRPVRRTRRAPSSARALMLDTSMTPTPYAELNLVLDHLLAGVRAALGENLVGAYLQGSFAVGDFTPWSDCDFIVVTGEDLRPAE